MSQHSASQKHKKQLYLSVILLILEIKNISMLAGTRFCGEPIHTYNAIIYYRESLNWKYC